MDRGLDVFAEGGTALVVTRFVVVVAAADELQFHRPEAAAAAAAASAAAGVGVHRIDRPPSAAGSGGAFSVDSSYRTAAAAGRRAISGQHPLSGHQ